ncbi:MAG: hypothetical protein VYC39_17850 [Myxococcota bacterium]|nr:hypothetical protein [Myxococcota bacterium]
MSKALLFALFSSLLTASCVLIGQGIAAQLAERARRRKAIAANFILELGRATTPSELASSLKINSFQAQRLLSSMVDDYYFSLRYDRKAAEFQYGFTEKYERMKEDQLLSDSAIVPIYDPSDV